MRGVRRVINFEILSLLLHYSRLYLQNKSLGQFGLLHAKLTLSFLMGMV